ncbi:MAG: hypothetical protein ABEI57_07495 [Halapricum sp.]
MSVTGVCDICERRTAEHSCPQCGAVVCDEHFDDEFGVCMRCAPTGRRSDDDRPDDRPDDDVDTFRM